MSNSRFRKKSYLTDAEEEDNGRQIEDWEDSDFLDSFSSSSK
jgi:hypothetical protein